MLVLENMETAKLTSLFFADLLSDDDDGEKLMQEQSPEKHLETWSLFLC